jgi:linoleoyl-CoA desaturase
MVHRTIARLAFPGGKPRPKPGPYTGEDVIEPASANGASSNGAGAGANGSSHEGPAATENVPAEGPAE